MIRDIYSRDAEAPKFNDATLEVSDALSQLIIKIENVLFTRKGEVLGSPGIGCNLDELIFSLVLNENTIQNLCKILANLNLEKGTKKLVPAQFMGLL